MGKTAGAKKAAMSIAASTKAADLPLPKLRSRYKNCAIKAVMYEPAATSLSSFLAICSTLITGDETYWFRGHSNIAYRLVPSALRFLEETMRNNAIQGVRDVQRVLSYKLPRAPAIAERLKWLQIAQHYGYPTRLLDWTQNPVVALYFACCDQLDKDGLVVVMRPVELNAQVKTDDPRIFDYEQDKLLIDEHLNLDGIEDTKKGKRTIAISPSWDHERIFLQQGFFTLHGSRHFELDSTQASSLTYIAVPREFKQRLISELSRVGMGEMFVYPEPEHTCSYIKRQRGLS